MIDSDQNVKLMATTFAIDNGLKLSKENESIPDNQDPVEYWTSILKSQRIVKDKNRTKILHCCTLIDDTIEELRDEYKDIRLDATKSQDIEDKLELKINILRVVRNTLLIDIFAMTDSNNKYKKYGEECIQNEEIVNRVLECINYHTDGILKGWLEEYKNNYGKKFFYMIDMIIDDEENSLKDISDIEEVVIDDILCIFLKYMFKMQVFAYKRFQIENAVSYSIPDFDDYNLNDLNDKYVINSNQKDKIIDESRKLFQNSKIIKISTLFAFILTFNVGIALITSNICSTYGLDRLKVIDNKIIPVSYV